VAGSLQKGDGADRVDHENSDDVVLPEVSGCALDL
jgi:hypothetical protein